MMFVGQILSKKQMNFPRRQRNQGICQKGLQKDEDKILMKNKCGDENEKNYSVWAREKI